MGFFIYLLVYAAAFLLAELFKPKPDIENAKPAGLGDFNFPTATEGRVVPLVWGTVELSAPNVIWFGDLRTDRIREKVKTGIFSSKKVTVGYEYFVGMQFGLCRGPMGVNDGLMQIKIDEDVVFDTLQGSPPTATASGTITVNQPTLFGSDAGGIVGNFGVFPGSETQARSTYLEGVITQSPDILPAYRGTHYVVAEQIYIGNQPTLRAFKFTVRRIPDGLNLATSSPGTGTEIVNQLDANPMNVLYEILTNADWGLAISAGEIEIDDFRAAAQILFDEGNGFSGILDNQRKTEQIIQQIEDQIDGVLVRDTATGRYTVNLIREAQIPSPETALLTADSTNTEKVSFSRATWSETTNQVRVDFNDYRQDFKKTFALAQDMANNIIQNSNVSVTKSFMGVKNAALANQLAWRDLRALATPLAKATVTVNREFYEIKPGDPFLLTWPPLGITNLLMRVNRLDFGELLNNKITIDAIEDAFTSNAASFGDPIDSGWTPLEQVVIALSEIDQLIFETPRNLNLQDPEQPLLSPRITTVARKSGGAGDEYVTLTREHPSPGTLQALAFTENLGATPNFVVAGTLRVGLPATGEVTTFPAFGATQVQVDPISESLAPLIDAEARTATEINNLLTLVYITSNATPGSPDLDRDRGEFLLYTQAVESIGGSPTQTGLQLNGSYRGVMDSAIQSWPAGSKVWFIGFGGAGITSEAFVNLNYADAKLLPSTQESGTLAEGDADPTNTIRIDDGFRINLPLKPNDLRINNIRYDDSVFFSVTSNDIDFLFQALNWRTVGGVNTVLGLNSDGSTFNPADEGDGLSFIWELYDEGSPSIGSPSLISTGETAVDQPNLQSVGVDVNDIFGVIADPNGGRLRFEVQAFHRITSPGLPSREKMIHSFEWTQSTANFNYPPALNLGRIPYGTVVSPGVIADQPGSPGSPADIPLLRIRFANGARLDEGPGTGENGKFYLITDDASPAQLIYDAQVNSPAITNVFTNIDDGTSPSNFKGKTLNVLHYHNTGRPIFFHIENQATNNVIAFGVLEPQTNTVPESINRT